MDRHVRHVEEVVCEVLLDQVPFVAQTNDEIIQPVMAVCLHNGPKNWLAANLDHGLRFDDGLSRKPGSETTRKNNHFH